MHSTTHLVYVHVCMCIILCVCVCVCFVHMCVLWSSIQLTWHHQLGLYILSACDLHNSQVVWSSHTHSRAYTVIPQLHNIMCPRGILYINSLLTQFSQNVHLWAVEECKILSYLFRCNVCGDVHTMFVRSVPPSSSWNTINVKKITKYKPSVTIKSKLEHVYYKLGIALPSCDM